MSLNITEQLRHITVRLECNLKNGQISTGTGFYFTYKVDEERNIPVIVTNKHVITDSVQGSFVLTKGDNAGNPIKGSYEKVVLDNFESRWIPTTIRFL